MRITKDDERARRVCSLALSFMNSSVPLTSSEVARRFYPDLSPDSFRRAFSRDRVLLAACGLVVRPVPTAARESAWAADRDGSFAGDPGIDARGAEVLETACRPLLDDPEFPLSEDLRFALAKLTRTFAYPAAVPSEPSSPQPRAAGALRDALVRGRGAHIGYTTADGRSVERDVAPYALFCLRGLTYLVAATLGEGGEAVEGETRTYRVDRMDDARVLEGVATSVPADFSVDDWRRLPFQLGEAVGTAAFEVPAAREADVRRAAGHAGTFSAGADGTVWEVEVSDLGAAASWAVAQGIVPLRPQGLVEAWRETLEGEVDNG